MLMHNHLSGFGGQRMYGAANADAMDTHTGYTESSGTISASTEFNASYPAWKAADGSIAAATNDWITAAATVAGWLKYQFTTSQLSGGYSLQTNSSASYLIRMPKDWTFEGSNNGSDWDVLDTQAGESGWSASEKRTYTFVNNTHYEYYRLNITDNNGATITQLSELEILI